MKVIDLLNKIANGENIKVKDKEGYFSSIVTLIDNLNSEVEVKDPPKEDKKIKRIEERESGWWANMADGNVLTLKQAVNEIIDKVNKL